MTVALHTLVSQWQCRKHGHDWIVTTKFNPPPKLEDGAAQLRFNMLILLACHMGLPEFALLSTGMTDVERLCHRCGKYEKGVLWGKATEREAAEKELKVLTPR